MSPPLDPYVAGLDVRKAEATEGDLHRLVPHGRVETVNKNILLPASTIPVTLKFLLRVDVDFRGFGGRVLDDEEDLGDEFYDVARLEDEIPFPLVAQHRGRMRLILLRRMMGLELEAARLDVLDARRGTVKLSNKDNPRMRRGLEKDP